MTKFLQLGFSDDIDTKALRQRLNELFGEFDCGAANKEPANKYRGERKDPWRGGLVEGLLELDKGKLKLVRVEEKTPLPDELRKSHQN